MNKFSFYKASKQYMQGHSKLYFYTHLPLAYIKFKWYSRHD
jgi:hypothetical protein